MDNLDIFQEIVRRLSSHGRDIARNFFIGILSAEVPPEIWDNAIRTLERMINEYEVK